MDGIYIDGDFESKKGDCKYHCSPSCHPAQIDENNWVYGCTHKLWYANRVNDFVPIVKCKGEIKNCDFKGINNKRMISGYLTGRRRRIATAENKVVQWKKDIEEVQERLKNESEK